MTTYSKENASSIIDMFASIAKEYDRANAILSLNLHHYWNHQLVKHVMKCQKESSLTYLDLCSGTGEIAKIWLSKSRTPQQAYLLDFCSNMLDIAKAKMDSQCHQIQYLHANAEIIPLGSSFIDAITIAYGIRNIHCIENCFNDAFRVLKSGGVLGILELTEPSSKIFRLFHHMYLKRILPKLGGLVTKNREAYSYLCQSIQAFVKPSAIREKILDSGFQKVDIYPLSFGIATLIIAKK